MYFIDTCALLKAYLEEKGSKTVLEALSLLGRSVFVSDLVTIEALGKLAKKRRSEEISKGDYLKLYNELQADLQQTFYIVPVNDEIIAKAYTRVHTYRDRTAGPADHIHICTAESIQSLYPAETVHLMSSDRGLSSVARELGFEVFDPERDPVSNLDLTPLSFPRLLT